jgi:hypothetical protein
MGPGEQLVNRTTPTVEISERWLEAYELGGAARARHWDARLTGLGVILGRRRVSFVVQRRVDGEQRLVTLGHWAPRKLRQLDPGLRDRTLTVEQARGKAIEYLGQMRGGDDPRGEDAPQAQPVSPTLAAATELHLSRMRKDGASPRGIETLESRDRAPPRRLEAAPAARDHPHRVPRAARRRSRRSASTSRTASCGTCARSGTPLSKRPTCPRTRRSRSTGTPRSAGRSRFPGRSCRRGARRSTASARSAAITTSSCC